MTDSVSIENIQKNLLSETVFGRYRVSTPYSLFEFNSNQDILLSDLFNYFTSDVVSGGTVTHDNVHKNYVLSTNSTNTSSAVFQTKAYWRYQSGKASYIAQTFRFGSGTTNTVKRVGYFDDLNGIFLEQNNGTIYLVLRSNITGTVEEERVEQKDWNVNPLNRSGTNGELNLDFNSFQIMSIEFQWLGAGRVEIKFSIGDKYYLAHAFYNANLKENLYMESGSLPLRYEISNIGNSVGSSLRVGCGVVGNEGGSSLSDLTGNVFNFNNNTVPFSMTTSNLGVCAIRLKSSFLSSTNRGTLVLGSLKTFNTNRNYIVRVIYNPTTLVGGSWTGVNTYSMAEYNVGPFSSFSGGREIDVSFAEAGAQSTFSSNNLSSERMSLKNISGTTSDVALVTVKSIASSGSLYYNLSWKEFLR